MKRFFIASALVTVLAGIGGLLFVTTFATGVHQMSPTNLLPEISTDSRAVVDPDIHNLVSVWNHDAPIGWKPHDHRSQCIVRVRLSRSGKPVTGFQWFHFLAHTEIYWDFMGRRLGMAAGKYHEGSGSLFILFDRYCRERYEITLYLFTFVKDYVVRAPEYIVSKRNFHTARRTIRVCGHWWIDGDKGVCHISMNPPDEHNYLQYIRRWFRARENGPKRGFTGFRKAGNPVNAHAGLIWPDSCQAPMGLTHGFSCSKVWTFTNQQRKGHATREQKLATIDQPAFFVPSSM